jgi:hypothetical protein
VGLRWWWSSAAIAARLAVASALVAPAAAPVAAADETVDAGALRARIDPTPFRLTCTDMRGRETLGRGTLQLPTGRGTARALRASGLARDGEAVTATLVTWKHDPRTNVLTARVSTAGGATLRLSGTCATARQVPPGVTG